MSALLGQLEGRERRAECLRNDKAMNGGKVAAGGEAERAHSQPPNCEYPKCECPIVGLNPQCGKHTGNYKTVPTASRSFFAECEEDARQILRGEQK